MCFIRMDEEPGATNFVVIVPADSLIVCSDFSGIEVGAFDDKLLLVPVGL